MDPTLKLIVGLGNPGPDYEKTRHNAGEWFISQIATDKNQVLRLDNKFHGLVASVTIGQQRVYLLHPTTFMNHSGQAVGALCHYYKIKPEEILVAHDELDMPSGQIKLKFDGGHGGHNGLRDIVSHLGSKAFYRLRIGIGHPGHRDKVLNYVLNHPTKTQREAIEDALVRVYHYLPEIVGGNIQKAMKQLHTKSGEDSNKDR